MSKKLLVCDIDDTLLISDPGDIGVYKIVDGEEIRLTTEELAKDPDKNNPNVEFDYREFNDPIKIRDSILNGTPILKNLQLVDKFLNKGYDFAFLTARGGEEVIKDVLYSFMKYRNLSGHLQQLGKKFKRTLSYACGDERYCEILDGVSGPERKAKMLKKLCDIYDDVVFIDDDTDNLNAAQDANLSNLAIIDAKDHQHYFNFQT